MPECFFVDLFRGSKAVILAPNIPQHVSRKTLGLDRVSMHWGARGTLTPVSHRQESETVTALREFSRNRLPSMRYPSFVDEPLHKCIGSNPKISSPAILYTL